MKYEDAKPNQWQQPIRKGYKFCCCDCGLTHELDFRLIKKHIQFKAKRDKRATGQVRRWL